MALGGGKCGNEAASGAREKKMWQSWLVWVASEQENQRARERELLGLGGKKAKNPKKGGYGFCWQRGYQVFLFR
ncbi:hypothetical protein NC652_038107 [Populus alba x Populus x berolinensis]|nr:hypothetical protein NC652_038107 [Populus alba x Populus x berolinensis]